MREEFWLWLAAALGPAASNAALVLEHFPDPAELVSARLREDLSPFFTPAQAEALRSTQPEDFIARRDDCARSGVGIVTFDQDEYPALLRTIPTPPPVLYYRGDITLFNRCFSFAMVGTRRPSAYGVEATGILAEGLARADVMVVSGLADGLDSEGHKAALRAGGPTAACMAFGHDRCYPASNRRLKALIEREGVTVSEYPPGTDAHRAFFLQRNRLIAGLSHGVCVAEARRASGTMNTVSTALSFGRDVFAVPGSIFSPLSEGTNSLLRQGAVPAVCAGDILAFYGLQDPCAQPAPEAAPQEKAELSDAARAVRAVLGSTPCPLAEVCRRTEFGPAQAMAALTELELAGISRQLAGRRFVLLS